MNKYKTNEPVDPLANYHLGKKSPAPVDVDDNGHKSNSFAKLAAISVAAIFLLTAILAFLWFSKGSSFDDPTNKNPSNQNSNSISGNQNQEPTKPQDNFVENPINGIKLTQDQFNLIKDRKPIAVMVNNYVGARPTSGLPKADIVFEAVAEGGITRLMPIFYSNIPEIVGTVRSARYYFAELAASYKPHYIHWGLAHRPDCQINGNTCGIETDPRADAKDRIVQLGLANLDLGNYACQKDGPDCVASRDPKRVATGVATEHTAVFRPNLVWDLARRIRPQESWHQFQPFKKWTFKDEAEIANRGEVGLNPPITYNYWDTMAGFNVKWEYDKNTNLYTRFQGNVKQTDFETKEDLKAKVVVIRFTKQEPANDKKHHTLTYLTGKGDALIFQDGKVTKGFWSRTDFEDMDLYTDETGNEIVFNRGQVWVQLVPVGNKIVYEKTIPVPSVSPTKIPPKKT